MTGFRFVRVGWEDPASKHPVYRMRCDMCGAFFYADQPLATLRNHLRSHEKAGADVAGDIEAQEFDWDEA